jgi:hypothetical protein
MLMKNLLCEWSKHVKFIYKLKIDFLNNGWCNDILHNIICFSYVHYHVHIVTSGCLQINQWNVYTHNEEDFPLVDGQALIKFKMLLVQNIASGRWNIGMFSEAMNHVFAFGPNHKKRRAWWTLYVSLKRMLKRVCQCMHLNMESYI